MDILRKSLAPISQEGWNEIEEQAKDVFENVLTARRFVEVDGPNGIGHAAVNTGRLEIPEGQKEKDVRFGIKRVLPLMETRKSFKVNIWELDNAVRGAEDINLEEMENAAKEIAEFEENAIYNGFEKACIKGLKNSTDYDMLEFPDSA
ncbi:MAG: family 1 encapsulin nanocompartment shell protein, partial [Bacteroidota bacterium]